VLEVLNLALEIPKMVISFQNFLFLKENIPARSKFSDRLNYLGGGIAFCASCHDTSEWTAVKTQCRLSESEMFGWFSE